MILCVTGLLCSPLLAVLFAFSCWWHGVGPFCGGEKGGGYFGILGGPESGTRAGISAAEAPRIRSLNGAEGTKILSTISVNDSDRVQYGDGGLWMGKGPVITVQLYAVLLIYFSVGNGFVYGLW